MIEEIQKMNYNLLKKLDSEIAQQKINPPLITTNQYSIPNTIISKTIKR